jgi:transposase
MVLSTTVVAFDQHAATTVAAVLLPDQSTPAVQTLTSDRATILRCVRRLGMERMACAVIAPALIPRRPGDRIKTDRRDARHLAILYRAGALTAIHIPTEQDEAARDLLRCPEGIRVDLLRPRHRLAKFLLRHGQRFTAAKKAWTKQHAAWLQAQRRPLPALEQTHRAHVRAVDAAVARLRAVEVALQDLLTVEPPRTRAAGPLLSGHGQSHRPHGRGRTGRRAPLPHGAARHGVYRPSPFGALQRDEDGARGHHENGQCSFTTHPGRSRLALPPSSFVGRSLQSRQRGAPAAVIDLAWHAQPRPHRRYRQLAARGNAARKTPRAASRCSRGRLGSSSMARSMAATNAFLSSSAAPESCDFIVPKD